MSGSFFGGFIEEGRDDRKILVVICPGHSSLLRRRRLFKLTGKVSELGRERNKREEGGRDENRGNRETNDKEKKKKKIFFAIGN